MQFLLSHDNLVFLPTGNLHYNYFFNRITNAFATMNQLACMKLSSLCTVLIRRKKFTWIPVNVLYSTISFRFYINVNKSINWCKTEGEQVGYQLVLITSVYNIVKYEGECRVSRNYLYYQENQNYYIMISDKEWVSFYQVEGRLKESIKTNVQQKTQRL